MNSDKTINKDTGQEKTILGHPRGLFVLFWAEMWERFSFYGMRALLIFYITWHFLISEEKAYALYGANAALVYLAPLIGGYIADKYLGFRKAVTFGAILLVVGHGLMGFHGNKAQEFIQIDGQNYEMERPELYKKDAKKILVMDNKKYEIISNIQTDLKSKERTITYQDSEGNEQKVTGSYIKGTSKKYKNILLLALAFIVAGVGFLKPNISTCVGTLYAAGDKRRDAGFTIYYMGINIGAALSSLLVGWIGLKYGWAYGFGLAAIGMLFGLFIFLAGQSWLEGRADPRNPEILREKVFNLVSKETLIYGFGFLLVAIIYFLFQMDVKEIFQLGFLGKNYGLVASMLLVISTVIIVGLFIYNLLKLNGEERGHMMLLLLIVIISVFFWTLFEQAPISLNLFSAKFVGDNFLFFKMTPPQLQAFNPLIIVAMASVMTFLWTYLAKIGKEPTTIFKFGIAMILIGLGYWILNFGIKTTGVDLEGNPLKIAISWIFFMYLFHTLGELCLSPIGLSSVTKLSIPNLAGFMMGVWFLGTAFAQITAEQVAKMTIVPEGTSPMEGLMKYNEVYYTLGLVAVILGIILLVITPLINKTIGKNAN